MFGVGLKTKILSIGLSGKNVTGTLEVSVSRMRQYFSVSLGYDIETMVIPVSIVKR